MSDLNSVCTCGPPYFSPGKNERILVEISIRDLTRPVYYTTNRFLQVHSKQEDLSDLVTALLKLNCFLSI